MNILKVLCLATGGRYSYHTNVQYLHGENAEVRQRHRQHTVITSTVKRKLELFQRIPFVWETFDKI